MEIVPAYLISILAAGTLWFLVRWFETTRDPELEAVYRQYAEEDRIYGSYGARSRRRTEAEDELSAADLDRCCVSIGDAFGLART